MILVYFINWLIPWWSLQSNASLENEQQELKKKYSRLLDMKMALDQELITVQNDFEEEAQAKTRLEQQKNELESEQLKYNVYCRPQIKRALRLE